MRGWRGRTALATWLAAALVGAAVAWAASIGVGDRVPDDAVKDWNGRQVTLAERRGRVVVVDFWATWCPICRTALPELDAFARRHPDIDVLAVNIDDGRDAADRFVAERLPDRAVTLLHDPGGALFGRFGADGMPALYVIDREGVVRVATSGYTPERLPEIEREIVAVASGRP